MNGSSWTEVGSIPSNFGDFIIRIKLRSSTANYIQFKHSSYLGLGYLKILKSLSNAPQSIINSLPQSVPQSRPQSAIIKNTRNRNELNLNSNQFIIVGSNNIKLDNFCISEVYKFNNEVIGTNNSNDLSDTSLSKGKQFFLIHRCLYKCTWLCNIIFS